MSQPPPQKASTAAAPADWEIQRDASKAAGDAAFRQGQWEKAIQAYTQALSVDPENAKLLSNRSAAYLKAHQTSKALHDAQACVALGTMGVKGRSRLAAALQALKRWEASLQEWQTILKEEPQHAAARKGVQDCQAALEAQRKQQQEHEEELKQQQQQQEQEEDKVDDLDDFFNDVDEATEAVVRQKHDEAQQGEAPTDAIKHHKQDLGTGREQMDRLLAPNYVWRNLNPFLVLQLDHTASDEDISRRFKALSLLLHPDKNRDNAERAQQAFDEVLKAKNALLKDENKAKHIRQLVEQGLKQGKTDFEQQQQGNNNSETLQDLQSKAVQRIFAQVEHKRREVEERQRNYEQRERQQEEEELDKERQSRKFDKSWKQEERVGKRVGNWRDFQKNATNKKAKS